MLIDRIKPLQKLEKAGIAKVQVTLIHIGWPSRKKQEEES